MSNQEIPEDQNDSSTVSKKILRKKMFRQYFDKAYSKMKESEQYGLEISMLQLIDRDDLGGQIFKIEICSKIKYVSV